MFREWEASRKKVKLLDQIRISLRTKQNSWKTEESYTPWIKQFIIFNNKTHRGKLGKEEIQLLFWAAAKQHC